MPENPSLDPSTRLARCQDFCWRLALLLAVGVFAGLESQQLFAQEIKQLRTLDDNHQPVRSVAFTPDGKILAAGGGSDAFSDEKTAELKLWDVAAGKVHATLNGHKWCVWCVAITPDGKSPVHTLLKNRGRRRLCTKCPTCYNRAQQSP